MEAFKNNNQKKKSVIVDGKGKKALCFIGFFFVIFVITIKICPHNLKFFSSFGNRKNNATKYKTLQFLIWISKSWNLNLMVFDASCIFYVPNMHPFLFSPWPGTSMVTACHFQVLTWWQLKMDYPILSTYLCFLLSIYLRRYM